MFSQLVAESDLPGLFKDAFTCPHCGTYAHQKWYESVKFGNMVKISKHEPYRLIQEGGFETMRVSKCQRCFKSTLWSGDGIIYPWKIVVPQPNETIPKELREIYLEAGRVLDYSIRASGALIRLSLELLLRYINQNKESLDKNIGLLVSRGIPEKVQKALDFLRIKGNYSVHPESINMEEKREDVLFMFQLFNLVYEELINRYSKIDQLYENLPDEKKEHIRTRDGNKD